jgi:hypothetical protein
MWNCGKTNLHADGEREACAVVAKVSLLGEFMSLTRDGNLNIIITFSKFIQK